MTFVGHLLERVDDVVGGEGLPVVPDDVGPQAEDPHGRVVVRLPLEDEARLDLERRADAEQRVVDVEEARRVDERRAGCGIDGLARAAADVPDAQSTPALWVTGWAD